MSSYEDGGDFFAHMVFLLDSIEVRERELLKLDPEQRGMIRGRLGLLHDQLEQVAVEIDREVLKAGGEKVGPRVSVGSLARMFSDEPLPSLAEMQAEIHEALDAKRVRKRERKEEWLAWTPSGREYELLRIKHPHEEASYRIDAVKESA